MFLAYPFEKKEQAKSHICSGKQEAKPGFCIFFQEWAVSNPFPPFVNFENAVIYDLI